MNVFFPPLHRSRCLLTVLVTFLLCLPLLSGGRSAQAAPASVRLPGHIPAAALLRAHAMGRVPSSQTLSLVLTLPVRDPAGLQTLLDRIYTPGDPLYGHYLTTAEFTSRFSPTQQSYDAVIAFARAQGLTVTRTHPNRLLVDVSGSAATVEAAFSVHMQRYTAASGRIFHAPDSEPAIPVSLIGRLSGVIGLDDAAAPHPLLHRLGLAPHSLVTPLMQKQAAGVTPASYGLSSYGLSPYGILDGAQPVGTDPITGFLQPSDIKAAYELNTVKLNGAGQTLGLFELDTYTPSDITTYENAYGLPNVPLVNIPVDPNDPNFPNSPGGAADEVTLDIEVMTAIAPGASKILVYEAPDTLPGVLDELNQIATDNLATEISFSYGLAENEETSSYQTTENTALIQMAAQGQSFFASSGDSGAYTDGATLSVSDPASQPYAVGVGGTSLFTTTPGGPYGHETAWSDPSDTRASIFGAGGGGGISTVWPLPDYQTGVGQSRTQRNVPDVSLDADPNTGYAIYFNSQWTVVGGTSAASPIWAAFTALANQQRANYGEKPLGFPNPTIYQIGKGPKYSSAFHDIADGSTNLFYPATAGYDNATGWGSFNGAGLLPLFAPPPVSGGAVASVTLTPNPVVGGLTVTGTVTLANPAPTGGAVVALATNDTVTAPVPATLFIAAGQTSADFTITTATVKAKTTDAITATYQGNSQTAILTVQPPVGVVTPLSLSLSPSSVNGGDSSTATVILTGPAPVNGLNVTLSSSNAAATVPGTVTVPAGAVSASFIITTSQVSIQVSATITAAANGGTATATLTVLAPTLEKLVITPPTLPGGQSAIGTLNLTLPAPPGGAVVTLGSYVDSRDNSGKTPADPVGALTTVTIPAGKQTATFPVTTTPVPVSVVATIKASYAGLDQIATLQVQSARIVSVSVAPASLTGGSPSTGTVTLDSPVAATAGLVVTLAETSMTATIPATVTVLQGASTATFPITTTVTPGPISDTITATLDSRSKTTVLTIQPIQVINLSLSPSQVVTGAPSQGTVTVNAPAPPGGLAVALSSLGAAETLPASALVPAGATAVTFPIATPAPGISTISAVVGGQTRTATLTVMVAPGTSYPAGLNMISSPYDFSGQPLAAVFGVAGVKLATWQPGTATYAITPTAPADTLHLGHGYWVRLAKAVTLASAGTPADPTTDFPITLGAGWNQIGDPFLVPITLSNLHISSGGTAATFAQATTGAPLLLSGLIYSYSPSGAYVLTRGDGSLQPGVGYWIYAYQPVTLIVPHPGQ